MLQPRKKLPFVGVVPLVSDVVDADGIVPEL